MMASPTGNKTLVRSFCDGIIPTIIRGNIGGIRKVAKEFDKALWRAYSTFRVELQARRHREWDRRAASRALAARGPNGAG